MTQPPGTGDAPSCALVQSDEARLVYVRHRGELRHVTTFRDSSEEERLSARCPSCDAPVTIRLGKKRIWHAAHRAGTGAGCAATAGESALHLNAKIEIREALLRAARDGAPVLRIALACTGTPDCPVPTYREWLTDWDDVAIECRVGSHRPDLVLFRKGTAVGAIEVLVSHQVGHEKEIQLGKLAMPWVEVPAVALRTTAPSGWTSERPLPVQRASRDVAWWRCPRHEAEWLLMEEREKYRRLKEAGSPEAEALIERGLAIRDMATETERLAGEVVLLQQKCEAEEAERRRQLAELPRRIREAEERLDDAKRAYEAAIRAAAEREGEQREDTERVALLESQLRGLDEEAARFEGLRRALSGLRPLGIPPGPGPTRPGVRTLYWCPVDVYHRRGASGKPTATRGMFRVDRVDVPNKGPELWLIEDWNRCIARIEADDYAAEVILISALDRCLEKWRRQGALVDHPTEWIHVPLGEQVPGEAWDSGASLAPRAYRWDEAKGRWVLRAERAGSPDF